MTPRLFASVAAMEARRRMSYRADFWVYLGLNFVAAIAIPWCLWSAIYASTGNERIEGYSFHGMLAYYCLAVLLGRVVRGPEHLGDVAEDIYHGHLSRYLIYPSSYVGFKYAQHIGGLLPHVLQLVVFCPLLALVAGVPEDVRLSPFSVVATLVTLGIANWLYYLLAFPLQSVAFWADNVWSLSVLLRIGAALLGGAMVPISLFPEWGAAVARWLPFAALYDLPVNTLLGKFSAAEWGKGILVALGWCALAYWIGRRVFRRGERSYSGVGI